MSKEIGLTMTTIEPKSSSTTASDARMSWGTTSITHEAAVMSHGGGHAPSTSRAEPASKQNC